MQVLCGKCGRGVDVGNAAAGTAAVCPHCGAQLVVPSMDPGDSLAGVSRDEVGFAELSKRELSGTIDVGCSKCRRVFIVSVEFAGRRAKCPACGTIVQVPILDGGGRQDADSSIFSKEIQFADARPAAAAPLPSAPAPPVDEALPPLVVDEPPPAAEVLSAVSGPRAAGRRRKQRVNSSQLVKFAVIVGMVIVGAAAIILVREVINMRRGGQPEAADEAWGEGGLAESPPVGEPEAPPVQPVQQPERTSNGSSVEAGVIGMQVDVFAGNGYAPARADMEYWKCDMMIAAGDSPVVLVTEIGWAVLTAGQNQGRLVAIRPLGNGLRIDAKTVIIPPGTRRDVTFVFEMPTGVAASVSDARLTITDVGAYYVPVSKVAIPAESAVFGTFVEMQPRNLKPVLADPIMAAIQRSPRQQISITKTGEDGGLAVSLPDANITGTGTPDGEGNYALELTDGRDSLSCRLRVLTGGRVMLYLADEPFHQMTFGKGGQAPTATAVEVGVIELVETGGQPNVPPPPTTPPIVQTPPETDGDGSFFDP